ncbi:hypothetical protein ACTOB_003687 [Actinoplanes oblitus]|uniref:Uncharacterized protein n=1 Tax=Actinoplanes oblitus TaxID=3040509 RepID=A0ABY8WQ58_9ACTN|nr:hypothetical protein [Actinoplanes oblitus]WIN00012.1 hypothetical protein ACTOB_003687 [Actinoplanes oblitus]
MLENDATATASADTTATTTTAVSASRRRTVLRTVRKHAAHPVAHVSGLIGAHIVALTVLDKTPLLIILGLH